MKIAYIFFGQVKNFDLRQFHAFEQNIALKLSSCKIDYHLVTSKSKTYNNPRQQHSEGADNEINYSSIKKYFDFKNIFYDELDSIDCSEIESLAENLVSNFGGAWGEDSLRSTVNSLKQIYSLEFFYDQFSKLGEDYDAYILSRSDLFHTHPIDADCLSRDGDIFIPYYDALPQIDYGWFGGVNDRFAIIKNQSTLKTYCKRYSSIKNDPQFYHAEKYLKQKLESSKTDIQKIHNFEFRLMRSNGNITDQIGIYPSDNMNQKFNGVSESFFINLDRRLDRLDHICSNLPFFANRYSAIDGNSAILNEDVKKIFPKTWKTRKKAEVCCAMSHYNLWKKLVNDNNSTSYLILEDDAVFKEGSLKFWNEVFCKQMPKDFSIIYLGGCQPWNKPHYHKVLSRYNDYFCNVKTNDYFTIGDNFWHMNASSYILSKQAACLLCQWVEQNGMDEALDNFMQRFFNENKLFSASESIYHLNPPLAYQLHEEGDNCEIDKNSDIRHAEDTFDEVVDYIDVCFCCDENLIEYAVNPINAISQANQNNNIRINFIYSGKVEDLQSIKAFLSDKDNILFREYLVEEVDINVEPSWRKIDHLSNATNLKLQIPEIIKDVDRVIYFDIDTIPNVDLTEMHKIDISGSGIAMRGEVKNGWRTFNGSKGSVTENKKPVDFGEKIIGNSGVMVLDLKRLRRENFTQFCLKEKRENNYKIPLTGGDQDLINIFCKCQYDPLPLEFNILIGEEKLLIKDHGVYLAEKDLITDQGGTHWHESKRVHRFDSHVLHFIGKDKPWNSDCFARDQWKKFDLNTQIPKKIFQTWKTKNLASGLSYLSKTFKEKNKSYKYELFDDVDCRDFIQKNFDKDVLEVYDRIKPGAFKADLWRYCVLYKRGGVFSDIDMLCLSSFDCILGSDVEFFAPIDGGSRGEHNLFNAFIGSVPNHPVLKKCIDIIVDNVLHETWKKESLHPLDFSACGVLGRAVNEYMGRGSYDSFQSMVGVHGKIKLLDYQKIDHTIRDAEGNKFAWNKYGNPKIKSMVEESEKQNNVEPWIFGFRRGELPYERVVDKVLYQQFLGRREKTFLKSLDIIKNELKQGNEFNIVEFGTSRSFANGYIESDESQWRQNAPETWDWGSGYFTKFFAENLKQYDNVKIHSVDPSDRAIFISSVICKENDNVILYQMTAEEFLKKIDFKINFLYMDHMESGEQACLTHLKDAEYIIENSLLADGCAILHDDVNYDNTKSKSKYSIPFLLNQGYEEILSEYQSLMLKSKSFKVRKNKIVFTQKLLFEKDFLMELIGDEDIIYDEDMNGVYEDSLIVYSDIISKDLNIYKNESFRERLALKQKKLKEFLSKQKNCRLVHLSDEHRFADIEHYKNFKHVFRQYYRSDAVADNVTFIPLGYKVGFYDE